MTIRTLDARETAQVSGGFFACCGYDLGDYLGFLFGSGSFYGFDYDYAPNGGSFGGYGYGFGGTTNPDGTYDYNYDFGDYSSYF